MDISRIKNHPGFMPFGYRNTKTNKAETQSSIENAKTKKDNLADAQVSK